MTRPARAFLSMVLLLVGVAVLTWLVLRIGPGAFAREAQKLGWNILWVLLPSVGVYVLDALGWRSTLGRYAGRLRFDRLFMTRMAGEAVNFTTPAAYLGGEPVKAYMLSRHNVPLIEGLASVITAKTTMTLAQVLFILIGVAIALGILNQSGDLILTGLVGVGVLGATLTLFLLMQRRGLFVGLLRVLDRIGLKITWLTNRESKLQALDDAIANFYAQDRRGFRLSFLFFFGGWLFGSLETYLILYFLGVPVDIVTAVAIEALAVLVKGGTAFIPGSLGAQEAGTVVLLVAFGHTEAAGITYALVRRLREILWIAFGLWAFSRQSRPAAAPAPYAPPAK